MISLKKQKGFTLVELLIVIIIIGILATLVIVTFTGVQQKARDAKRQTDINALKTQLEAFYATTGYYPTLAHFSDTSSGGWVATNMKGLDPNAEKDPKFTGSGAYIVAGTGDATHYGYAVTCSDTSDETTCSAYTLTATLESGGTFSKSSNT